MRKFWKNLATAVVCSLSLATSVFGQSAGDEVVVVVEKTDLKHDTTVVETTYRGSYLTVRNVNGNWLWVAFGGSRGWINREHVILASRAIDYFTDEIRRNPKDSDALIARAIAWQNRGELTNAIRDCTDAIAINPEGSWAYLIRGNVWFDKKEHDLAIADYEEGIRLDPKHDGMFHNRGLCHHEKKHYDKAIADFTEAIRLNPKSAGSFASRGHARRDQEQYDKALADYAMAIEFDPHCVQAYQGRGVIYHRLQLFSKRLADLEYLARIEPDSACRTNNLALILATCPDATIRDGHRAVQLATKAVELEQVRTMKAFWRDTLAAAHAEVGDFEKAIETQQAALQGIGADDESRRRLEEHLKLFQSGTPRRISPKARTPTTTASN